MSQQINDGGSAFPVPGTADPQGGMYYHPESGMSLRDWFAGQALTGFVARGTNGTYSADAKEAYNAADAMLKARQEKGQP